MDNERQKNSLFSKKAIRMMTVLISMIIIALVNDYRKKQALDYANKNKALYSPLSLPEDMKKQTDKLAEQANVLRGMFDEFPPTSRPLPPILFNYTNEWLEPSESNLEHPLILLNRLDYKGFLVYPDKAVTPACWEFVEDKLVVFLDNGIGEKKKICESNTITSDMSTLHFLFEKEIGTSVKYYLADINKGFVPPTLPSK